MFATSITLTGDAGNNPAYDLTGILDGRANRADATQPPGTPRTLVISHQATKRGTIPVDRHLARLGLVRSDAVTGVVAEASVQLVIEMPRVVLTAAHVQDMVTQLKNFLTVGNVTKLLNNEP